MAGFDFSFKKLKGGFFDTRKVKTDAERFNLKAQSKFGAHTWRRMKSSIKYRKGTAAAGSPPSAHRTSRFFKTKVNKKTGATSRQALSPLRELIFFARDADSNSVVIGPVAFGKGGAGVLERGGWTTRTDPRTGKEQPVRIAPHPYARPAGDAEAGNFPDLLRTMVN